MTTRIFCVAVLLLLFAPPLARRARAADPPYFEAPAGSAPACIVPGGTTILPNGRFLTPQGERLYTGPDLWNVAVRPDGRVVVGFSENGLVIHARPSSAPATLLPLKKFAPAGVFTPDGARLIVSQGDDGNGIAVYDTSDWAMPAAPEARKRFATRDQKPVLTISAGADAYINDLVLAPDGKTVYGADVARGRVVVFDLAAGKVVASVKAGRQPYALALSPNGKRLYVANIGLFDYSVVPAPAPNKGDPRGLAIPAFGFPSKASETGVEREGRFVPGLGKPTVPDAQSIYVYALDNFPAPPRLVKTAKAGLLIHAPADGGKSVGGSAPNKLLARGNVLYVSNANNDTVQLFNAATLKPIRTIKLTADARLSRLRGVIPSGMALSGDGSRLYVCESGLNSVAVVTPASGKLIGRIPTGWFPVQVVLSPDEKTLYVATQKGLGRGPRGAKTPRPPSDERFGLSEMPGLIAAVPVPNNAQLRQGTQEVARNNGLLTTRAAGPKLPPQIKHVVFITKENHTFDGIFGGLRGANGEPEYAEWGREGWIREKGKAERVPIMPNHLRLAEQFAISDNFYMEPQASGDGHRWLVGVYPSLWTARVFYAGWDFKRTDAAKGRLVSFGSNGSQIPEDYLENGSLWEHLARGGIIFRNYGEGYELPDNDEGPMTNRAGGFTGVNYPMPKVLYDNTCFDFPSYNNNIPDIARTDWFIEDLEKYRRAHGGAIPRFLNIAICNDHGADPDPKRGYPYVASYMADNDLALGRIVEYLSRQPEWKSMAIFVTQDDSGADDDHVDRHRSFVLAISPWAKRGHVAHAHTSIMSIIKTIYRLFGLGPNNLFDALATDLSGMFTTTPNFSPYTHVPSDRRVFRPEETFDPSDPTFERRRRERPSVAMDDPAFVERLRQRGDDERP